jgi:hypothetical protein
LEAKTFAAAPAKLAAVEIAFVVSALNMRFATASGVGSASVDEASSRTLRLGTSSGGGSSMTALQLA